MFKKYICMNCGGKFGKNGVAKDKSGSYTCVGCQKKLSRYFPGCYKSTAGQITENISRMQRNRQIYDDVIMADEDRIVIKNENLGIVISEKHGLFKVIDNEWAEFNPESDYEIFRLDEINRYEIYDEILKNVYINNNAFVECGVRIYMNSEREPGRDKYKPALNQRCHPYVNSVDVLTASADKLTPSDIIQERGIEVARRIVDELDRLLGKTKEDAGRNRLVFGIRADEVM